MFISKHEWSSVLQIKSQTKWEHEVRDNESRVTVYKCQIQLNPFEDNFVVAHGTFTVL